LGDPLDSGYDPAMPTIIDLDGRLLPPAEARIPVLDRGFLQGDSVYEVLRTYGGRPFELDLHLARLWRSAELAGLEPAWDGGRSAAEVGRTLAASLGGDPPDPEAAPWNLGERSLRVVMTRGGGEAAPEVPPAAVIIAEPLRGPPLRAYREGVKVLLVESDRRRVDPAAKTGSRLAHVLALRRASAAGAHEALFTDAGGRVSEGTSSNLFAVRGGRLLTPPLEAGILEGVTRGVVQRLAQVAGVVLEEAALTVDDLEVADELFITSTAREILPVTRLGDAAVGRGTPGPVTLALHAAFRRLADELAHPARGGSRVGPA
jgi:branched-chain amino acid aminotransferase